MPRPIPSVLLLCALLLWGSGGALHALRQQNPPAPQEQEPADTDEPSTEEPDPAATDDATGPAEEADEGKGEEAGAGDVEGAADTVQQDTPPETGEEKLSARERRRLAGIDPCRLEGITGRAWLDRLNRGIHRAVCASALWFDDLFSNDIYEKREGTHGRLLVGLEYDDREELGEVTSFQAHFDLPKAEQRLSGFIGRGDRDEIVGDRVPRTGALPNIIDLPGDDEWLVGLGYSPQRSRRNSDWSVDIGADIEFPLNWYGKARYRHIWFPTDASMFRLRQTMFWEREDGWGTTTRFDWDYLVLEDALLRWRNLATVSEGDAGVDWYSELTLYQNLGERQAIAYQLAASGESDAEVPLEFVLARVIYRRSVLRDWFYIDIRPGVSYRRDEGEADRELRPMLAIGAEIAFGENNR